MSNFNMMNIKSHMDILGHKVVDRVTGFTGVAQTVSFDLYGCVQASVMPGLNKDGDVQDCYWFDISRLEIKSKRPVMDPPNYEFGIVAEGLKGAAPKPTRKV